MSMAKAKCMLPTQLGVSRCSNLVTLQRALLLPPFWKISRGTSHSTGINVNRLALHHIKVRTHHNCARNHFVAKKLSVRPLRAGLQRLTRSILPMFPTNYVTTRRDIIETRRELTLTKFSFTKPSGPPWAILMSADVFEVPKLIIV